MSLTGTVWADTVWADIWGPIWGARKAPQSKVAEAYSGGYFSPGDKRTKKQIDDLRQKLGILPKSEDNLAQEVAELANTWRISPSIPAVEFEYDEDAAAKRIAKVARSAKEAEELSEISRLLAKAEAKRQQEEFEVVRMLWRLIS